MRKLLRAAVIMCCMTIVVIIAIEMSKLITLQILRLYLYVILLTLMI